MYQDTKEVINMRVEYNKLWDILACKEMTNKQFALEAGISEYTLKRLRRNEHVTTETMGKISKYLNIPIESFVDFI